MREGIARVVEKMGYHAVETADAEQALPQLDKNRFVLVVTDYKLPGMDGIGLLQKVKESSPETEVLIITAYGTIELAVEAMQKGAADFITKPFSPEELNIKIEKILERIQERAEFNRISEENLYLREEMDVRFNYGEIVGDSPNMQEVYRTIEKVAKGDSSVIIYGESGTGKELVARAIHKASPRKDKPFVRVNCGALAEGVLESELFGHEKGAFTGALRRKKGRFELAQHGSIFLDEIGDIPLATQMKLLRVLQEKEFERVGGEETLSIDVRIIAATNKNLKAEIADGRFREDLYYRLHIIPIYLPPLREREADIPLLTEHFINKIRSELNMPNLAIDPTAIHRLKEYDWPGNIREFENILERAAVLCDASRIRATDIPFHVDTGTPANDIPSTSLDLNESLEKVEKQLIEKAMDRAGGVKTEAAKLLNIKASALYYKLEKYGLI
ncbi:sigma-54-dependent Fis family transcriptional regulator [candidate division KSB1 bacterium]|nr:sigma-54-dependent Fis family transcriptional regulator [candidate division KSB1 bacterium]NIR68829.1 sigma-54-dependent Fis family transcriptional regulator [candidate division KSB1 bacterium]NIS27192.1 sigma-54-dependent Fis family transcriptional regulator [candidate division KSB1 bacterium]NIT74077.1 sigma-54-dependent Fis family transcriptional regulator [candidate division KSB1 bacterium]NIU27926.1 sigma-54-dependent Fis family transcriptional regulator [candidate division KSB1 bacteri